MYIANIITPKLLQMSSERKRKTGIKRLFRLTKDEFNLDLTGLTADSEYEVRIRAMNRQGWSQLSEPFLFRTTGRSLWVPGPVEIRLKSAFSALPLQNYWYECLSTLPGY
jgi:hypothetical protein